MEAASRTPLSGSTSHAFAGRTSPVDASDTDLFKPVQKRRRISRACDECRREKVKCSGQQPCSHCATYGYHCTYDQPSKRHRSTTTGHVHTMEVQLERAKALLSELVPNLDLNDSNIDTHIQNGTLSQFLLRQSLLQRITSEPNLSCREEPFYMRPQVPCLAPKSSTPTQRRLASEKAASSTDRKTTSRGNKSRESSQHPENEACPSECHTNSATVILNQASMCSKEDGITHYPSNTRVITHGTASIESPVFSRAGPNSPPFLSAQAPATTNITPRFWPPPFYTTQWNQLPPTEFLLIRPVLPIQTSRLLK